MGKKRILSIFGTRSEAVKMAPVLQAMREAESLQSIVCITAQHRQKLDQVLSLFSIKADFDLNLMKPEQPPHTLAAEIITNLQKVIKESKPDYVLLQGSSLTSVNAALSAYYNKIGIGYIGSGYRSGDLHDPWPNEGGSRVVSALADHHFAPTQSAETNLLQEGVDASRISVVGSTAVDGVNIIYSMLLKGSQSHDFMQQRFPYLKPDRKIILVACSRFSGDRVEGQMALADLLGKTAPEVDIVVLSTGSKELEQRTAEIESDNVYFLPQQDYLPFIYLVHRSFLVITDSGIIQEEAPSLDTPVLIMREKNDRMDAVNEGLALLVSSAEEAADQVRSLLDDTQLYGAMSGDDNPFGDGRAASRIVSLLS